ncbi:Zn-dependent oligopeptidase [Natronosporangium hydrolyticum]|uniref:Zn-dependent oligopeptidase n=1 Tax=Natronosporangium hydrolyticum TaxID=2811111 RepID=A0A895YMQ9_9ACTN|nr:M3 family metallopeptidase [Natronosporangium hydrolyticum]QSB15198.1 Zn-dependent oligopeptidase [Natronosporangium hydrolyticum]
MSANAITSAELRAAPHVAAGAPEAVTATAATAIATAREGIAQLTAGALAGLELLRVYDEATAALTDARGQVQLISKVHPDPAIRAAAETAEQELAKVSTDISLDRRVYDSLSGVDVSEAAGVDPATRHWLGKTLRDFRRAGVDRDDQTRARLRQLQEEMVGLAQTFSRNIDSDTRTVPVPAAALAGLPADWVAAHPVDAAGYTTVTTDNPDVVPFLTYSRDPEARRALLTAWRQRGYPANIAVLADLLARRHEFATLLGYPNWADYATEDKMIGSEPAAADFIEQISAAVRDRMRRDYQALLVQKRRADPTAESVAAWDGRYLTEQVKAEHYQLDTQAVRPYFEYERVKAGLLALCTELFGISFEPRPDVPVWHPEVAVYDIHEGEQLLGRIFLDMHPRPDKFSHAAMYHLVSGVADRRLPECALVCNFPRPGEQPALLEPADVRTFFHEFGHLLHHIFGGGQRWAGVSGVRTERDFIEAPSQLLEEWMRDPATLARFAHHHETGEPIPPELAEQLRAADEFGQGLYVSQQMFYAALSLELHRRDPATLEPLAVERETERRHGPYEPVADAWLHLSFGHLTGYSATYYTYMWSLVIAKDMFTAFDPAALRDPATAGRYRAAVLAPGGSAPAAELVRDFLGREFTSDAYRAWLNR